MTVARRRFLGSLVAALFLTGCGLCLPCFCAEPRILLVGDSWAQGVWLTRVMEAAFKEAGMGEVGIAGEATALGGTRADQWVKEEYRAKIAGELAKNPSIHMVHLIIGGNDVLKRIKETNVFEAWDELHRQSEWRDIADNVRKIVEYCLSFPQIKHVVIGGYDYLNAKTAREALGALGQNFDFGGMTQTRVNQCFIAVEGLKRDLAKEIKGCAYVHNIGLAQHHYDVPKGAPAPGDPPDYNPFPGGNPDYPMPDQAFTPVTLGSQTFAGDGIHPSEETHKRMILHAIDQCYRGWFASK
jgi:hypothetical protein